MKPLLRDRMALLRRARFRAYLQDMSWSLRAPRLAIQPLATRLQRFPSQPMVHRRTAGGFTLIELVAALILLALLSAVLFGIVGNADRSVNAASSANDRAEQMLRLNGFLHAHVGGLLPLRWRRELGQPLRFEGRENSLSYLAPVISHIAEGGVLWWRLEVEAGEATRAPRLVLRRLAQDPELREIPDFREAEAIVLAEGVSSLRLRYFDPGPNPADEPEGGRWVTSWDESSRSPNAIEIALFDQNEQALLTTTIKLAITPAVGCTYDFQRQRCLLPGVPQ